MRTAIIVTTITAAAATTTLISTATTTTTIVYQSVIQWYFPSLSVCSIFFPTLSLTHDLNTVPLISPPNSGPRLPICGSKINM